MAIKKVRVLISIYDFTDITAAGASEAAAIALGRFKKLKHSFMGPDTHFIVLTEEKSYIVTQRNADQWIQSHRTPHGPADYMALKRWNKQVNSDP